MGTQRPAPRASTRAERGTAADFRAIFEQSPIGIIRYDRHGLIKIINPAARAIFGIPPDADMRDVPLFEEPNLPEGIVGRMRAGETVRLTTPYDFARGGVPRLYPTTRTGTIVVEALFTPLGSAGRPSGFLLQVQDVTARIRVGTALEAALDEANRAGREIERSLREKELLLREVHHRVKNNLQVVISLLTLQLGALRDEPARLAFQESLDRIRSMALIHERLLKSANPAGIGMQGYLDELLTHLLKSYGEGTDRVCAHARAGDLVLDIDTAATCGLIVNELVSNSLKHAFPDGRTGSITVDFSQPARGQIVLAVADDGVGFPAGRPPAGGGTTGLALVRVLCEQLDGTAEISGERGVRFRVGVAQRG